MAADFIAIQARYAEQRPDYEQLAETIRNQLETRLDARGLETVIQCRAKEVLSFTKKALRKGYADPLKEIGDKAGVRVIVHYTADIATVEEVVAEIAIVHAKESKLDALAYDELGYLGIHLELELRSDCVPAAADRLSGLRAELQIHTKAQSAWAVVSHDLLYKSPVDLPVEIRRGITRLVALVELFDDEVARLRQAIEDHPDLQEMRILEPLDNQLIRFTPTRPDHALSALAIPAIMHLYAGDAATVMNEHVLPFLADHGSKLRDIYDHYENDARANPLLFQPEALLVFERLENDVDRIRDAWPADRLPLTLLDNLATIWGLDLTETD